jgi:hypothetical protein
MASSDALAVRFEMAVLAHEFTCNYASQRQT